MAAATAVAIAIALASAVVYFLVRQELRSQVDQDLERMISTGDLIEGPEFIFRTRETDAPLGGARGYAQVVSANGAVLWPGMQLLPVTEMTMQVARGAEGSYFSDMVVDHTHVRVFTTRVGTGLAVQIARPLDEVDSVLDRLKLLLFGVAVLGIGLAAVLGAGVARMVLAPVRRLTQATEHVTDTSDLTHRIAVSGDDELNRLAASFNSMLDALENSLKQQRQLVADASHELRTPLTSLRTNIEVLANETRLSEDERARLRTDVVVQLDELTGLIGDLVELARGNEPEVVTEELRLDQLIEESIERMQRISPEVSLEVDLEPLVVEAMPQRLGRAVNNLLDNAIKWSLPGGTVHVSLEFIQGTGEAAVTVRDEGAGIASEDLPLVFDRFYRSAEARGMQGSGLGLAIVKQVAESHGGRVEVWNHPDGGAVFRLIVPARPLDPSLREEETATEHPVS